MKARLFACVIIFIHINVFSLWSKEPPIPNNFQNDQSWCWFSSALHCFYRIDYPRNLFKKFSAGAYEPGEDERNIFSFCKQVSILFDAMEQKSKTHERINPQGLYNCLMNQKNTEFLQDYLKEIDEEINQINLRNEDTLELQYWRFAVDSAKKDFSEERKSQPKNAEVFPILMFCAMKKLVPYGELFAPLIYLESEQQESLDDLIKKIKLKISAPAIIDGNNFGSVASQAHMITVAPISSPQNEAPERLQVDVDGKSHSFELVGAMITALGHVVAYVKYGDDWYLCDDASVKEEPEKQINFDRKNCEVAFYEKIEISSLQEKISELKKRLTMLKEKLTKLNRKLKKLQKKLNP